MADRHMLTSGGVLTQAIEYDYDAASDLRIRKRLDSNGDGSWNSVERYIYDGPDIILVMDESGGGSALASWYLHGPQADDVLARWESGTKTRWALGDQLGSVRDVVEYNAGGFGIVRHFNYSSYGAITSDTSPTTEFFYSYTA